MIINSSGIYNYTYVYENDILIVKILPDGSKRFYHPDHLGSTTLITDEAGNVIEETEYLPYGSVSSGGTSEDKLYENKELDDTGTFTLDNNIAINGISQLDLSESCSIILGSSAELII